MNEDPDVVDQPETKANPLFCITPFSKYFATALFVALPFLGAWIGYEFAPGKVVEMEKVVEIEKIVYQETSQPGIDASQEVSTSVDDKEAERSKFDGYSLKTFSDPEVGISFQYPVIWGEVTFKDERAFLAQESTDTGVQFILCEDTKAFGADPCLKRFYQFTQADSEDDVVFMSVVTRGFLDEKTQSLGRGGFWADRVVNVTPSYLQECQVQLDCSILLNENNIQFSSRWHNDFGWDESYYAQNREYRMHNGKKIFTSFLASPIRLKRDYVDPELESIFEKTIIQTFEFTN